MWMLEGNMPGKYLGVLLAGLGASSAVRLDEMPSTIAKRGVRRHKGGMVTIRVTNSDTNSLSFCPSLAPSASPSHFQTSH